MVSQAGSPASDNNKSKSGKNKLKKNALDHVNYEEEFKKDPKFKTELCKTFNDTGFCAYGNRCRFAHGKDELFSKMSAHPKYRRSDCLTFYSNGFCNYGPRCHFRHHECLRLEDIPRSFYEYKLSIISEDQMNNINNYSKNIVSVRLPIFKSILSNINNNYNTIYTNRRFTQSNTNKRIYNLPYTPINNIFKPNFTSERKSSIISNSNTSSNHSRSPINSTMSLDQEHPVTSKFSIIKKLNFNNCDKELEFKLSY